MKRPVRYIVCARSRLRIQDTPDRNLLCALVGRLHGVESAVCLRRKNLVPNSLIHPPWLVQESDSNIQTLFNRQNHRANVAWRER